MCNMCGYKGRTMDAFVLQKLSGGGDSGQGAYLGKKDLGWFHMGLQTLQGSCFIGSL